MKTTTIWMFIATLAIAGCTGSMMGGSDEMRSMIDGLREENEAHLVDGNTATTMDGMRGAMARHDLRMHDMMADMESGMAGMSHCAGSGMDDLHGLQIDMMNELDGHEATVVVTVELPAARAEVVRHVGAMRGMLGAMHDATARMGCRMGWDW